LADVTDVNLRETLRKRIAALIALTFTGVLKQLYLAHPDLCPAELRDSLRPLGELDWPILPIGGA